MNKEMNTVGIVWLVGSMCVTMLEEQGLPSPAASSPVMPASAPRASTPPPGQDFRLHIPERTPGVADGIEMGELGLGGCL